MANGSGAAIAGVIIGIIVATQVGSVEGADLDADSAPDENVDSTWDDDDSTLDDDDDSTPQAVPTQVDGGLPADEAAGPLTSLDGGLEFLPSDSGLEPGDTLPVLSLGRNDVGAPFCAMPAASSCCATTVVAGAPPWLRWPC